MPANHNVAPEMQPADYLCIHEWPGFTNLSEEDQAVLISVGGNRHKLSYYSAVLERLRAEKAPKEKIKNVQAKMAEAHQALVNMHKSPDARAFLEAGRQGA